MSLPNEAPCWMMYIILFFPERAFALINNGSFSFSRYDNWLHAIWRASGRCLIIRDLTPRSDIECTSHNLIWTFSDRSGRTRIMALTLVLNFRSKTMNPVTWWPRWDGGWDWSFAWYRVSLGLNCIGAEKGCQYVVLGRQFTSVHGCWVCGFDVKLRGGAWKESQRGWQKVCRDAETGGWFRRLELSDKSDMDSGGSPGPISLSLLRPHPSVPPGLSKTSPWSMLSQIWQRRLTTLGQTVG